MLRRTNSRHDLAHFAEATRRGFESWEPATRDCRDLYPRQVKLALQGACGSCPSSTTTMKMGIERVLKENFPDMGGVRRRGCTLSRFCDCLIYCARDVSPLSDARTYGVWNNLE